MPLDSTTSHITGSTFARKNKESRLLHFQKCMQNFKQVLALWIHLWLNYYMAYSKLDIISHLKCFPFGVHLDIFVMIKH